MRNLKRADGAQWAHSLLQVKAISEDKRTIEGIASTPQPDSMGDVVELDGMEFSLPLPFLYQHNSREPIGWVQSAKKTNGELVIRAQIAKPGVHADIDRAWAYIKEGLVGGLSIGFKSLEHAWMDDGDGIRFIRSKLFEISAVTIPANSEATITAVKSIDSGLRAALGIQRNPVVRLSATANPSGVTEQHKGIVVKPISESITSYEAKLQASEARLDSIIEKSTDEGRTLDDAEQQEVDNLQAEIKSVANHIALLKSRQSQLVARATTVVGTSTATGVASRTVQPIQVIGPTVPKGTAFVRMVGALVTCKGNRWEAGEYAKRRWSDTTPEVEIVLKAAVEAGDTTTSGWASQLIPAAQQMQNEFLDLLRPATIIGRIPGLRRVPFNISVPVQTGGGTYAWVGEAVSKPVTKLTLSSATLRWAKAAGIIVITKELAMFSSPSAETLVRNDMIQGITRFLDQQFVDPSVAAVTNVSPASITNGISATAATGTTAAAFRANVQTTINKLNTNGQDPANFVILMSATVATNLSMLLNALGQPEFPNVSITGGSVYGFPVIISQNVGARIIFLNANEILLAEDGGISIDVSDQASVEMEDYPAQGESSPLASVTNIKSFWQNNLVGLRVERFITWVRGRDSAVEYISGAVYSG
jgi:HK97 family phage major capsid protein/HK97 family phage prohead protease